MYPVYKFNEFEPRLKSAKNQFRLSAGLNLEKLNTILSGTLPYLSRGSNSLNSASDVETIVLSIDILKCLISIFNVDTNKFEDEFLMNELN